MNSLEQSESVNRRSPASGGSTAAIVETNFTGSMLKISVGSQEVWLTRDEALAVCDALPSAINHMPVKI
jgi:hypothetical protein